MNMMITKWGNSLGVRIPGAVAKAAGLAEGTPVNVAVRKGKVVLEPVKYNLAHLVAGITPENRHEAVESGAPMGNEIW